MSDSKIRQRNKVHTLYKITEEHFITIVSEHVKKLIISTLKPNRYRKLLSVIDTNCRKKTQISHIKNVLYICMYF